MGWLRQDDLSEASVPVFIINPATQPRQLPTPTGGDGYHHRLLPEGPHNIRADYRHGASERRLYCPLPEAGEGPGSLSRPRAVRL